MGMGSSKPTEETKRKKKVVKEITFTVKDIQRLKRISRLMGPEQTRTIIMHPISSYSVKGMLEGLELKDLKKMAKSIGVKVGKNKKDVVKNLWLSKKINQVAIVTD